MSKRSKSELGWTVIRLAIYAVIAIIILGWGQIRTDFSDTEASVKVLEVGTHYVFWNIGEQKYIRVQNAFSSQFSTSSEVWETCISKKDYPWFKTAKDSNQVVNITVKGNGLSTSFQCLSGDRVTAYRK